MREGTGTSLGVAGAGVTFFTLLGALLVFTTYLFVSIYALVKLIGNAPEHPNPVALIVGFVAITTLFVTALLVGLRFLGRSLNERKRREA